MSQEQAMSALAKIDTLIQALPPKAAPGDSAAQLRAWLSVLADRFQHPHEPTVVVVCGPTGAGKSHLVNFLAGETLSPSSYRRPSTVAPVLLGQQRCLKELAASGSFLPSYQWVDASGGVNFDTQAEANNIFAAPVSQAPWPWPPQLLLIDAPDFDSVRLENQAQALDMVRRADALILVSQQAKYADHSGWNFLLSESLRPRPMLLILNRVTASAAVEDFQKRLASSGVKRPLISWPEEMAVGQANLNACRQELIQWLQKLPLSEVTAKGGRLAAVELSRLAGGELLPSLKSKVSELNERLARLANLGRQWLQRPGAEPSLNLPGETRDKLLKNLSEVVQRSDLWAKPRRLISRPLSAAGEKLKKFFGFSDSEIKLENTLTKNLAEAGAEALVASVRGQARALAETAGLSSPQPDLDLSPQQIKDRYQLIASDMDKWLQDESAKLLEGLPLGQKAAFYLVQLTHLGLVLGFQIQTGGLPGTEILVGGALGPLISKATGALISRENIEAFERRAAERHRQAIGQVFAEQAAGYSRRLEAERDKTAPALAISEELRIVERRAERLWA